MPKGDDILERLTTLAVSLSEICRGKKLPSHFVNQLLRSGTSPAANYAEARSAESRKDFIHKLTVVLKELNECLVWLQLIQRLKVGHEAEVLLAQKECSQLCRIIAASIKTASGKTKTIND
jgi:four helix bundle protein